MSVHYNEIDPFAAQWLRNLIAAGHLPAGEVDERSIVDVRPEDLEGYTQCHFFAGIGGWPYALRLAGWPDDRPAWTGSCPCQPFSSAGKREGVSDERHLWPAWFRLIRECQPRTIFGEQVASAEVVGLEGEGSRIPTSLSEAEPRSRFGSARALSGAQARGRLRPYETPFGVTGEDRRWGVRVERPAVQLGWWPHMGQPVAGPDQTEDWLHLREHSGGLPRRQQRNGRLGRCEDVADRPSNPEQAARSLQRFVGSARAEFDAIVGGEWLAGICADLESEGYAIGASVLAAAGVGAPHIRQRLFWVADATHERHERSGSARSGRTGFAGSGPTRRLAHTDSQRRGRIDALLRQDEGGRLETSSLETAWSGATLIACTDGRTRRAPAEPSFQPLADGVPGRLGQLRAYGNAIVPQVGAQFVTAFLNARIAA